MKKLNYIDGIKVIATWIVFNNHFLSAFLPVLVYGRESKDIYTNLQEIQLSESAISILWGGHYAVTLFFLISAFLISYQLFTSKKFFTMKECLLKIVKRYLKFVIPILVMNVFVLLFLKLRLFMNDDIVEMVKSSYLWLGRLYHFNDNIWDCIYNALVEVIFLGDNKYNNALWTMTHEFYGSVLVYCIFYVIQMIRKVDERGGG